MKKLAFSILAVGLAASLGAQAALTTGTMPFQVVIPDSPSGIDFSIGTIYFKPTTSGLHDFFTQSQTTYNSSTSSVINTSQTPYHNPDYNFGYEASIRYTIPHSGNSIGIDGFYYDTNETQTAAYSGSNGAVIYTALNRRLFLGSAGSGIASNNVTSRQTEIYASADQAVSFGQRLELKVGFGADFLHYDNINSNAYNTTYNFDSTSRYLNTSEYDKTSFTGIGPAFNVSTKYALNNSGLGIGTQFLTGAVYGKKTLTQSAFAVSNTSISGLNQASDFDKRNTVVPMMAGKVYLDYTMPTHSTSTGSHTPSWSAQLGYQVKHYWNLNTSYTADQDIVYANNEDLTLQGAFLSIKAQM